MPSVVIGPSCCRLILRRMNVIGDLERLFATSLYPLRVPIAIAVGLAGVGLIVLARRRGWVAAAGRHPRRSGLGIVIVLAAGLPVAWYLASPLFIRTALIEPLPIAIAEAGPMAPAIPSASVPLPSVGAVASPAAVLPPTSVPGPAETGFVPSTLATGSFNGADDFHFGTGQASILETEPGRFTLRFDDFSVRNGPDLYVYLSPARKTYMDGAIEVAKLKATDGSFNVRLPAGSDPTDMRSVLIWCKQFSHLFAWATLEG